ncbi:MAG: NIPSNAP family protein [Bacteroidales bacterium]|nr:NIPSNAP family protein [Bacteroidales bacterium]
MENTTNEIIEIRTYQLKKDSGELFHKIFCEQSLPMLKRWNIRVFAYGNSISNPDSYFLIRQYKSLEERQISQDTFYGSTEWKLGPREAIVSLIENSIDVVVPFNKEIEAIIQH